MKAPPNRRPRWKWWLGGSAMVLIVLLGIGFWFWRSTIYMPGQSYRGPLEPLSESQTQLRDELRRHVMQLADALGERNLRRYPQLVQAAEYIEAELTAAGYQVHRHEYREERTGLNSTNLWCELPGASRADEIVLVGAHYDSAPGTPGANDNASGVAALLAIARQFSGLSPAATVRFVAFTNEEPPYFQTTSMGSWQYAQACRRQNENLTAVVVLETIGYYTDAPDSQHYPGALASFYPSTGDFIGVVGDVRSRPLVLRVLEAFRQHAKFPSEAASLPASIEGVGFSDHWSFWQFEYPAVMVTDTAMFRYPYYHRAEDTPDKIDFDRLARVTAGMSEVIAELAR